MTDQEMLQLAAKAAGYEFDGNIARDRYSANVWNPLVDDRDALRLAAKLSIHLSPGVISVHAQCGSISITEGYPAGQDGKVSTEAAVPAIRRAIVQVAAIIGKSL